jgi:hypothetical protein
VQSDFKAAWVELHRCRAAHRVLNGVTDEDAKAMTFRRSDKRAPRSFHSSNRVELASSLGAGADHDTVILLCGTERAPYLVALVPSSCKTMLSGGTILAASSPPTRGKSHVRQSATLPDRTEEHG